MSKFDDVIHFTPDGKILVANVHPDAALFMSKVFTDLAAQLEDLARQKQKLELEKIDVIYQRRHVDLLVAMMIDQGKSLDQAIMELDRYGIPEKSVRFLWKELKPRINKMHKREQQRTARRLARNRYTIDEIAEALGVSSRTVNRLLSGFIR